MSFDFFDPAIMLMQTDTSTLVEVNLPGLLVLTETLATEESSPLFDGLFAYSEAGSEAMIFAYDDPRIVMPMNGEGSVDDGTGGVIITGERPEKDLSLGRETGGAGGEGYTGRGGGGDPPPPSLAWTDPNQPTENTCANDAITITVVYNRVTIAGKISFEGAGSGAHTNDQLLAQLNRTWSGAFGGYTVTTNMTIGMGGLTANVSGSPLGQPSTLGVGGSVINTFTLEGRTEIQSRFTLDSFAHEFGHALGLINLYDERTFAMAPGYTNNIMGNSSAPPTFQNIRDLVTKKAAGCNAGN